MAFSCVAQAVSLRVGVINLHHSGGPVDVRQALACGLIDKLKFVGHSSCFYFERKRTDKIVMTPGPGVWLRRTRPFGRGLYHGEA
jgi:hypothetical protein